MQALQQVAGHVRINREKHRIVYSLHYLALPLYVIDGRYVCSVCQVAFPCIHGVI